MDIPPTTPETGLSGYYLTPLIGAYHVKAEGEFISNVLQPREKRLSILTQGRSLTNIWSLGRSMTERGFV
jgi:hypothetical protein